MIESRSWKPQISTCFSLYSNFANNYFSRESQNKEDLINYTFLTLVLGMFLRSNLYKFILVFPQK